jgi:hypothetical protein
MPAGKGAAAGGGGGGIGAGFGAGRSIARCAGVGNEGAVGIATMAIMAGITKGDPTFTSGGSYGLVRSTATTAMTQLTCTVIDVLQAARMCGWCASVKM